MNTDSKLLFTTALVAALLSFAAVRADDWPQWRGPNRDANWQETGVVEAIPATGLPLRWRARILNGWSGPAVANGRVYVTDHNYKSDPEVERVLCFDEATGKQLWLHEYPCPYQNMEYGNGPRATPTVHDGLVYALGTKGHLTCLDAVSGELIWKKDPVEQDAEIPRYGASAAPLVVDDLVLVSPGARPHGTLVAFDRKTGEERWRALDDRPGYSAPITIDMGGNKQVVLWTGDNVNSVDPKTGKLLWQIPYKASFDPAQATATPVVHKDKLLCLAAWNRGSMMIQLDTSKPGASIFWKTRAQPTANVNTPVFNDDDSIYTVVGDGALCRLNPSNGDEIWRTRAATSEQFGGAHIVSNGDRYFLLNQKGHLISAHLTPDGYRETGRTALIEPTAGYRAAGPVIWAHPAFANKNIYVRNDRELVCFAMAADAAKEVPAVATSKVESSVLPEVAGEELNQTLSVTVSPDGKTVALGTGWGLVRQVDLENGTAVPSTKRHNDWVTAVAYSADGKYLVSAGGSEFAPERNGGATSGQIKVWDLVAKEDRGQLEGHTNKVFAAAISPDGKTLATGGADKSIRLWNLESMRQQNVLLGHSDAISSLSWSRDGDLLASGSWDQSVKIWKVATGKELATLTGAEDEVLSVALSPDGQTVVAGSADWTVRVWQVTSQRQLDVLNGHRGAVSAIAFSPDGKLLATGSADESIKLWHVDSRTVIDTLLGHNSGVNAVAFSPNGYKLFSGAMDGPVREWKIPPRPQ
jgi:outer membrane protein assembly factor BamB